jgi:tRNA pseudouridine55 synthase
MPSPPLEPELNGALLIDKPAGPTSHDIVDIVRGLYRIQKVGHCGTLDPAATGLLILLLGRATKLSQKLTADDKVYEGTLQLGQTTDSYDAQGEVTHSAEVPTLDDAALNAAAQHFTGDLQQKPPMVSAVKKDGVPLYKLARKGKTVEREAKTVHVYSFNVSTYTAPVGTFRVRCSKGTYVRSLAHDLGQSLGCGAHLRTLHRTRSGVFDVAEATRLEELVTLPDAELPNRVLSLLDLTRLLKPE